MLNASELKGIIAAVVTPFTPKDELDQPGLQRLLHHLVECGVHGIMTTGGNGEFPHLLADERRQVLQTTVDSVKGKVPIIACTTACSVKETIMNTKHAESVGADAAIIVPPYYYKLPPDQIYQYYKSIAEKTKLPIVVYNNPGYTGNPIPPNLSVKILAIKGVIGLKQSEYDISQMMEILRQTDERVSILTGIDSQLFPALCIGGKGIFSTAACVVPRQMVKLYDTFNRGDIKTALKIQTELQILNRFFEYDPGYVAPCKEALKMMGLPGGNVRAPLPPLTEDEKVQIKNALARLGLV